MDGEAGRESGLAAGEATREARSAGANPAPPRPKTLLWLGVTALLLALVLASLYGFNRFRENATAAYFAHAKPLPAAINAVVAKRESVPRSAAGIGSLEAAHQVMVTPEVGGRVEKILFQSGAKVTKGALLVQLNDAPERADLANFKAEARLAVITLARSRHLVGRGFTPQQTFDQNRAALEEAKAEIEKTKALIAQKAIRAPFSGELGIRRIDLGQYLSPGEAIVTLTDLKTLYVDFSLPSLRRSEIAVGEPVVVTADAFRGRLFHAKITTIEPQISPATRTIDLRARMPNPGGVLLPGMFVNAAVLLPARPDTVVLPQTAVTYTLYGDSVYVLRKSAGDADANPVWKAIRTPVKTGREWGGKVAILSGLKGGERVVAAGQIKLHDGSFVVIAAQPPPQPPAHPTLH